MQKTSYKNLFLFLFCLTWWVSACSFYTSTSTTQDSPMISTDKSSPKPQPTTPHPTATTVVTITKPATPPIDLPPIGVTPATVVTTTVAINSPSVKVQQVSTQEILDLLPGSDTTTIIYGVNPSKELVHRSFFHPAQYIWFTLKLS